MDRQTVVSSALDLLVETGLEGLTLRRLAAKLNVKAPAIYWHFRDKQELLDEMATVVLRRLAGEIHARRKMRWDGWAMYYGRTLRRVLMSYRDGARMVSGTRMTDPAIYASMEAAIRRLTDEGFSPYVAVMGLSSVYCYVVGFVIEEQAVFLPGGEMEDTYKPEVRATRVDAKEMPMAAKAGDFLFTKFDRRFNDGLKLIVDGLRQASPKRARGAAE
ncbi:MAG TPA: TetR/AcrR family transcriptional regulator C-terminal domain-containing protein [Bryobacteraceae bacterium]|nr:TetR/AcrR family transcriptional regulator C-terminal domain-containing protein [Bryobacteraceae bacterium]